MAKSKLFWIGLVLYAANFFLIAVSMGDDSAPGYQCAWIMLIDPIGTAKALLHPSISTLIAYFSGSVVGLINAIFFLGAITGNYVLRIAPVLMMPFCWIVFYRNGYHPREGYVLWTVGMLLVLWSVSLVRNKGMFDS